MRFQLKAALTNQLNLAMLALAVAAGLCSAWWLFPLGAVLWVVMVIMVGYDPGAKIFEEVGKKRPVVAHRFQKRMDQISRSHARVYNAAMQASSPQQKKLYPTLRHLQRAVDEAFLIAERLTVMENHRIVSKSPEVILDSIDELRQKIETSQDPGVVDQLTETKEMLEQRLIRLEAIIRLLEQGEAQFESFHSMLDLIHTEMIRLQGFDTKTMEQPVEDLLERIRLEEGQLVNFGESLNTVQ